MIKGILFDFDGTIVDSEITRFESINHVLEAFDVSISKKEWKEKYKSLGTVPILDLLKEKYNLSFDSEELYKRSHIYRDSLEQKGVPVIEGFREFYEELEDRNIQMIICSGGTGDHIKRVLKYSNLPKIKSFGREAYEKRKPAPDAYLKGLEILGLKPQDVLILDDARTGIESGLETGAKVIAINYDEHESIEELPVSGMFKDYTEIDIDELLES